MDTHVYIYISVRAVKCSRGELETAFVYLSCRMAFKGLIFVVLLRVVIPGYGPLVGTVPTRHVPNANEIGKAHGSGMAMIIPPNTQVEEREVHGASPWCLRHAMWEKAPKVQRFGKMEMSRWIALPPPWQTTAQQLLEAPNTDMPEEVRLSLQKALQAEQAKQQETKEPTKAEATERFQKATSQLKKAGQAKAQAEQRLAKAKEQVAQLETKLQDATEGLTAAETEVEESSKVYWKYALGLPKDAEDLAEGHAIQGDENLIHLILADMGSKLRPEQQQRLLDMAGGLRDQKRRKTDEAMPLAPDGAKVEANQESG